LPISISLAKSLSLVLISSWYYSCVEIRGWECIRSSEEKGGVTETIGEDADLGEVVKKEVEFIHFSWKAEGILTFPKYSELRTKSDLGLGVGYHLPRLSHSMRSLIFSHSISEYAPFCMMDMCLHRLFKNMG
jgi:hypothetical protein